MAETIPLTKMENNKNNENESFDFNLNKNNKKRDSNLVGPRNSQISRNSTNNVPTIEISDIPPLSPAPKVPPRTDYQKQKYYQEQILTSDGTVTGTLIKRKNTLTRPERRSSRQRNLVGRDLPPPVRAGATTIRRQQQNIPQKKKKMSVWECFSKTMTCCFFSSCLKTCGNMPTPAVQQAWREKVTLCLICFVMMCIVGFITFFMQRIACPSDGTQKSVSWRSVENGNTIILNRTDILIDGIFYDSDDLAKKLSINLPNEMKAEDLTKLFYEGGNIANSKCKDYIDASLLQCNVGSLVGKCYDKGSLSKVKIEGRQHFKWEDINDFSTFGKQNQFVVYNGHVLNLTDFFSTYTNGFKKTRVIDILKENLGRDVTLEIKKEDEKSIECIQERFTVGYVGNNTLICLAAQAFINIFLVVILGVVFSKFFMAVAFHWVMANRLINKNSNNTNSLQDSNINLASSIRTKSYHSTTMLLDEKSVSMIHAPEEEEDSELYTMCLVTCYSEGEQGIHNTLDSLASTTYNDKKKLIFVIADGIIRGEGNSRYTPDIICGLMSEDKTLPKPTPQSYIAIADGEKQHNMAKVHAGYFLSSDRRHCVPIIAVVKCGTPNEAKAPKPGNRGKRDSQLILMNFLSRVMFDDRMTPLDFDLCTRIRHIAKVNPDQYELVLMVDADTKVEPTSLSYMVRAMYNDNLIMGLCGETRIANKTTSFITCIQVFEYYISHHLGKGFESMFGGVTCLPGCFCMYRIKARKGLPGYYVPILANPDIVEEYSENVVETLHQKNLLLLGEDRFLTTLMLRTFPKRKMMFVPQALCKTIVPDTFKVLLSQRRRWINSTIHNLMELVLVRDLCGTFCFSMQFVVGLELSGTVVLPAAIVFTIYLIVSTIVTQRVEWVPILMLIAILGLPGLLIVITSFKWNYVGWMLIYLISLPIWNFVLPLYAMWHFDDFSWGETRKVQGSGKDDHGNKKGEFDSSAIPLKVWAEYEKERLGIKSGNNALSQVQGNSIHYSPQILAGSINPSPSPIPSPLMPSSATVSSSQASSNSNLAASLQVIGIAHRPTSGQANLSTNPAVLRAVQLQQKQAVQMQMARQNNIPNTSQIIRRFSTSNSSSSASPLIGANQSIHSRSSTAISSLSTKSASADNINGNSNGHIPNGGSSSSNYSSQINITSPSPVYHAAMAQLGSHSNNGLNGMNKANSTPNISNNSINYSNTNNTSNLRNVMSQPQQPQQPIYNNQPYLYKDNHVINNNNSNGGNNHNNNNNSHNHTKESKHITHLNIQNKEPPPVPPSRGISKQP